MIVLNLRDQKTYPKLEELKSYLDLFVKGAIINIVETD